MNTMATLGVFSLVFGLLLGQFLLAVQSKSIGTTSDEPTTPSTGRQLNSIDSFLMRLAEVSSSSSPTPKPPSDEADATKTSGRSLAYGNPPNSYQQQAAGYSPTGYTNKPSAYLSSSPLPVKSHHGQAAYARPAAYFGRLPSVAAFKKYKLRPRFKIGSSEFAIYKLKDNVYVPIKRPQPGYSYYYRPSQQAAHYYLERPGKLGVYLSDEKRRRRPSKIAYTVSYLPAHSSGSGNSNYLDGDTTVPCSDDKPVKAKRPSLKHHQQQQQQQHHELAWTKAKENKKRKTHEKKAPAEVVSIAATAHSDDSDDDEHEHGAARADTAQPLEIESKAAAVVGDEPKSGSNSLQSVGGGSSSHVTSRPAIDSAAEVAAEPSGGREQHETPSGGAPRDQQEAQSVSAEEQQPEASRQSPTAHDNGGDSVPKQSNPLASSGVSGSGGGGFSATGSATLPGQQLIEQRPTSAAQPASSLTGSLNDRVAPAFGTSGTSSAGAKTPPLIGSAASQESTGPNQARSEQPEPTPTTTTARPVLARAEPPSGTSPLEGSRGQEGSSGNQLPVGLNNSQSQPTMDEEEDSEDEAGSSASGMSNNRQPSEQQQQQQPELVNSVQREQMAEAARVAAEAESATAANPPILAPTVTKATQASAESSQPSRSGGGGSESSTAEPATTRADSAKSGSTDQRPQQQPPPKADEATNSKAPAGRLEPVPAESKPLARADPAGGGGSKTAGPVFGAELTMTGPSRPVTEVPFVGQLAQAGFSPLAGDSAKAATPLQSGPAEANPTSVAERQQMNPLVSALQTGAAGSGSPTDLTQPLAGSASSSSSRPGQAAANEDDDDVDDVDSGMSSGVRSKPEAGSGPTKAPSGGDSAPVLARSEPLDEPTRSPAAPIGGQREPTAAQLADNSDGADDDAAAADDDDDDEKLELGARAEVQMPAGSIPQLVSSSSSLSSSPPLQLAADKRATGNKVAETTTRRTPTTRQPKAKGRPETRKDEPDSVLKRVGLVGDDLVRAGAMMMDPFRLAVSELEQNISRMQKQLKQAKLAQEGGRPSEMMNDAALSIKELREQVAASIESLRKLLEN